MDSISKCEEIGKILIREHGINFTKFKTKLKKLLVNTKELDEDHWVLLYNSYAWSCGNNKPPQYESVEYWAIVFFEDHETENNVVWLRKKIGDNFYKWLPVNDGSRIEMGDKFWMKNVKNENTLYTRVEPHPEWKVLEEDGLRLSASLDSRPELVMTVSISECTKVKLFLCSRDIKVGDKIIYIGNPVDNMHQFTEHIATESANPSHENWCKIVK